jgi:Carboxypeptidase regulatory-like domain
MEIIMKRLATISIFSILAGACGAESPTTPGPLPQAAAPNTSTSPNTSASQNTSPWYKLAGIISDGTGAPIQGARVEALDYDGNRVSFCESDEHGNYALDGLPSGGAYTIVVTRDGYLPWSGIFNVFRDRIWNIVLQR